MGLGHGEFALVEFATEEECAACVTRTKNLDNWCVCCAVVGWWWLWCLVGRHAALLGFLCGRPGCGWPQGAASKCNERRAVIIQNITYVMCMRVCSCSSSCCCACPCAGARACACGTWCPATPRQPAREAAGLAGSVRQAEVHMRAAATAAAAAATTSTTSTATTAAAGVAAAAAAGRALQGAWQRPRRAHTSPHRAGLWTLSTCSSSTLTTALT